MICAAGGGAHLGFDVVAKERIGSILAGALRLLLVGAKARSGQPPVECHECLTVGDKKKCLLVIG